MSDVHFNLVNDDDKNIHGYLPERSEELSTGYDVRNAGPDIALNPFQKALIPLGFRAIIPKPWWFKLVPRSSTFAKKSLHCLYGTVDESYEGYWYFACQYIPERAGPNDKTKVSCFNYWEEKPLVVKRGDRIAQIILSLRYDFNANEISNEEFELMVEKRGALRGAGGFGSTGDK